MVMSSTTRPVYTTDPLSNLLYGLKAKESKRQYPRRLQVLLDFIYDPSLPLEEKCLLFYNDTLKDPKLVQNKIMEFVRYQLEERVQKNEIGPSTVVNYIKSTKTFLELNDIDSINFKKINRGLPKRREWADDRAPTMQEIQQLLEIKDQRIRCIVLILLSSGCRLGLFDDLQWKHITPIERNGHVVAAKIIVYPGDNEEYFSFISAEAYNEVKKYMDFRASWGENITKDSPVIRNTWKKTNIKQGNNVGSIHNPKPLKADAIKNKINKAWKIQNIRPSLNAGQRRHEFKNVHGLRKAFKTICERSGMKTLHVEMLLGHRTGLNQNYYRPSEYELLEDYLLAADSLTINEENRLKLENAKLKVENDFILTLKKELDELARQVHSSRNN